MSGMATPTDQIPSGMNKNDPPRRVLVVEDEPEIRGLIVLHLKREGFEVDEIGDGYEARRLIESRAYNLILLDWMLPNMSGLELTQWARRRPDLGIVPILFVTARTEPSHIAEGLDAGADDYLTKPFDPLVLAARVKALLRRHEWLRSHQTLPAAAKDLVQVGALKLNRRSFDVHLDDQPLELTRSEFRLLESLMTNQGKVLSRESLIGEIQAKTSTWSDAPSTPTCSACAKIGRPRRSDRNHPRHRLPRALRNLTRVELLSNRLLRRALNLPTHFPLRLLRWFLRQQLIFSGISFAVIAITLLIWTYASGLDDDETFLVRLIILTSLPAAFLLNSVGSLFVARRMVDPLGSLIEKTRRLRESPVSNEYDSEALTFDEPGEWFELESAVNRLGKDLRRKTIRLSREKTELRAIMSAASEAVLAISKERRVLFFNPQFAYLFNAPTAAVHAHVSELLRSPEVLDAYDEALRTGLPAQAEMTVLAYDERHPRIFQLSLACLRKKHNQEVYGVVGIFHDITELKRAERYRIDFVGNVSHELRTPLTSINGYLQTLLVDFERKSFDQAGEFLKIVAKNVTRLKDLVEDLLDLSTLESGSELRPERLSVREVTEAMIQQIEGAPERVRTIYGIEHLHADPKRIEQVLRNLIENAVRYVPAGRGIEVEWCAGDGGGIELHVRDDGPGIPVEHHARLFERFYRVDSSRSRTAGGTGIGLSLVKHIMLRHGGRVFVRSEEGQGAEFVCEFPGRISALIGPRTKPGAAADLRRSRSSRDRRGVTGRGPCGPARPSTHSPKVPTSSRRATHRAEHVRRGPRRRSRARAESDPSLRLVPDARSGPRRDARPGGAKASGCADRGGLVPSIPGAGRARRASLRSCAPAPGRSHFVRAILGVRRSPVPGR